MMWARSKHVLPTCLCEAFKRVKLSDFILISSVVRRPGGGRLVCFLSSLLLHVVPPRFSARDFPSPAPSLIKSLAIQVFSFKFGSQDPIAAPVHAHHASNFQCSCP
jgi:hypothetical protein